MLRESESDSCICPHQIRTTCQQRIRHITSSRHAELRSEYERKVRYLTVLLRKTTCLTNSSKRRYVMQHIVHATARAEPVQKPSSLSSFPSQNIGFFCCFPRLINFVNAVLHNCSHLAIPSFNLVARNMFKSRLYLVHKKATSKDQVILPMSIVKPLQTHQYV
jgi:hypothetical protein